MALGLEPGGVVVYRAADFVQDVLQLGRLRERALAGLVTSYARYFRLAAGADSRHSSSHCLSTDLALRRAAHSRRDAEPLDLHRRCGGLIRLGGLTVRAGLLRFRLCRSGFGLGHRLGCC